MLTLLIDVLLVCVVALVFASLADCARKIVPTWRRLRAELDALEQMPAVRVSVREPSIENAGAVVYRPCFGETAASGGLTPPTAPRRRPVMRAAA